LVEKRLVEDAVPEKLFDDVAFPRSAAPALRFVPNKLVDDAVVAKKFVVVAFDPVALRNVKFCKVEELFARMFAKVPRPEEVIFPPENAVAKRLVEEAIVAKKLVVVAFVPVAFTKVKFWRVEEPEV
jgi:hypothetical protein